MYETTISCDLAAQSEHVCLFRKLRKRPASARLRFPRDGAGISTLAGWVGRPSEEQEGARSKHCLLCFHCNRFTPLPLSTWKHFTAHHGNYSLRVCVCVCFDGCGGSLFEGFALALGSDHLNLDLGSRVSVRLQLMKSLPS